MHRKKMVHPFFCSKIRKYKTFDVYWCLAPGTQRFLMLLELFVNGKIKINIQSIFHDGRRECMGIDTLILGEKGII